MSATDRLQRGDEDLIPKVTPVMVAVLSGTTMAAARRCRCGSQRVKIGGRYLVTYCAACGVHCGRVSRAAAAVFYEYQASRMRPLSVHVERVIDHLQIGGRS
jgi:hypothetical protein